MHLCHIAVIFKALIGFIVAHFVHNVPANKQRRWRGMLLVPWVIPPAMSTVAWLRLFDPSYSAFNYKAIGPMPEKRYRSGGKYLASGFNKAISLFRSPPPNRVALLQFADMDAVKAFYVKQKQLEADVGSKYASFRVVGIEGVEQNDNAEGGGALAARR